MAKKQNSGNDSKAKKRFIGDSSSTGKGKTNKAGKAALDKLFRGR